MRNQLSRWAGLAGLTGGAAWVAGVVVHASKPVGCVAADCAHRPMRESGMVDGVLILTALVLLAVATSALVVLARRGGQRSKAGAVGMALALGGITVLALAGLSQALLFAGDFSLMPFFVLPGVTALVVGFLLLGITMLRSGAVPRWSAAALVAGTAMLLGFNEQTAAAWLAVPLGIAWMTVGYSLVSGAGSNASEFAHLDAST